jgi:hypothetical protein
MGDLNPNRAGNVLYLNDAGGDIDVIDDGVSNVIVAQLGNLINLQFKDTVTGTWTSTNEESLFETVLDTTDPLVARMDPGNGTVTVPMSGVNQGMQEGFSVLISKTGSNKLLFNIKPPASGWVGPEGTDDLNIEDTQVAYAAAPQLDRDYRDLL